MTDDRTNSDKVAEALVILGEAYRGDWSNFDGRTLRDELYDLSKALLSNESFDLEVWYKTEYLCPHCQSFLEHCEVATEGCEAK